MLTVPIQAVARLPSIWRVAADHDRTSAVISGLFIRADKGGLTMAATDGKVLLEEKCDAENGPKEPWERIIRGDQLRTLDRFVSMVRASVGTKRNPGWHGAPIGIVPNKQTVRFVCDAHDASVSLKVVEGTYPDYRRHLTAGAAAAPGRAGINLRFLASLASIWPGMNGAPAEVVFAKGWHLSPLRPHEIMTSQRALVMPITLPPKE